MRLTDPWFEARFIGAITTTGYRRLPSIEGAQGVFFFGPCARALGDDYAHGVLVPFANPRNALAVPADFMPDSGRWQMSGTSLHDLTLTPSIDLTKEKPEHVEARRAIGLKPGECRPGRMCWHGCVTNGEIR